MKCSSLRGSRWCVMAGLALVAVAALRARAPSAALPEGTDALAGGPRHWDDFIELVPAVQTPRTTRGDDRTRVFVRFPPFARVTLDDANDPRSLRVPPGTVIDRVESRELSGASHVIDVRGTEFGDDQRQVFRAYRALSALAPDTLFGVRFERGDPHADRRARAIMGNAMEHGFGVVPRGALGARTRARYLRLLGCAGCHAPLSPERSDGPDDAPRRATDASGLYSLLATLSDESVFETYRPRDANARRGFLTVLCPPHVVVERRAGHPRCGGAVARARLDVVAALRAGDADAQALCASRQALLPFLSERVRRAYADELAACGAGAAWAAPQDLRGRSALAVNQEK